MSDVLEVDLDGALGDTRPLWRDFVADAARRFAAIATLDASSLPDDRGAAADELDRWAERGIGDWRAALTRFAEDRAPVYLRPNADANAALRALAASDHRLGAFTDAPEPLARVALAHLGALRRIDELACGHDARERLLERLGPGAEVATSAEDLANISGRGAEGLRRPSA